MPVYCTWFQKYFGHSFTAWRAEDKAQRNAGSITQGSNATGGDTDGDEFGGMAENDLLDSSVSSAALKKFSVGLEPNAKKKASKGHGQQNATVSMDCVLWIVL